MKKLSAISIDPKGKNEYRLLVHVGKNDFTSHTFKVGESVHEVIAGLCNILSELTEVSNATRKD